MRHLLLLALAMASVLGVAKHAAGEPLTLEAITKVSRMTDVAVAPDGSQIAVVSNHSGGMKIWLVPAQGGEPKPLTGNNGGESSPQWSPDGSKIAYLETKNGQTDVYLTTVAGGDPEQVTNEKTAKHGFRWAPDGKQLAFISNRDKAQDIYVVAASAGQVARKLTEQTNEWDELRWAPACLPIQKK